MTTGCPDVQAPETPAKNKQKGIYDRTLSSAQPLTKLADGRFHITNGFFLTEAQGLKIFSNKRPTLVMKDMAKIIWVDSVRAQRTYSGKASPKDRQDPDTPSRKELTPAKVALIVDTVTY
ncbi:uncharacterized protein LOC135374464 [Ornithodoros turicata]|uniref:uncharacterized protein LOC135374464 n=1 Tax=Ornithodoros turicata TaxID=34597 RepID=UPI0031391BD7